MQAETYKAMIRGEMLRIIAVEVEVMDVMMVKPAPPPYAEGILRMNLT